jgi:hypothetical protein
MRLSSNLAKANYSNAMDAHNSAFYAFQMCFGASGVARGTLIVHPILATDF